MAKTSAKVDVADILNKLQKAQGIKIGSALHAIEPVTGYTTGNIVIDHLTGVGGFPKGRVSEVAGEYSTGKSTISTQCALMEQKRIIASGKEGYILYLDHERTLDREYMKVLGIDTEHPSFIVAQPKYIEDSAEIIRELLAVVPLKIAIFDSVGYMFTKDRIEKEFAQRTAAMDRARVLKALLDTICGPIADRDCAAIFVNHLYSTIPMVSWEKSKEVTSGGKGIDYASSLKLKLNLVEKNKLAVKDETSGKTVGRVKSVDVKVTTWKNKVAPNAYREAVVRLQIGAGFDNMWSAMHVLKANKRIAGSSAYWYFNPRDYEDLSCPDMPITAGRPGFQGQEDVLKFAKDHPEWRERIIKTAEAVLRENPAQLDMDESSVDDDGEAVDED